MIARSFSWFSWNIGTLVRSCLARDRRPRFSFFPDARPARDRLFVGMTACQHVRWEGLIWFGRMRGPVAQVVRAHP